MALNSFFINVAMDLKKGLYQATFTNLPGFILSALAGANAGPFGLILIAAFSYYSSI